MSTTNDSMDGVEIFPSANIIDQKKELNESKEQPLAASTAIDCEGEDSEAEDDGSTANFFSWRSLFVGRRPPKQNNYPSIEYSGESFIRLPTPLSTITSLSEAELVDRIKGAVFGQCLGDALGVHTEFLSKESSYRSFPFGAIPFGSPIRGWDGGDWTDDSDQMILILDNMLAHGGKINEPDFAARLSYWVDNGFSELGDCYGNGCGGVVSSAVRHPLFLTEPRKAARQVYERSGGWAAANGAVMRTSILGIPEFHSMNNIIQRTKSISECTHADPRCTASSLLCTTFIAQMLQGKYSPTPIIPDSADNLKVGEAATQQTSASSSSAVSSAILTPMVTPSSSSSIVNESITAMLKESLKYAEAEMDIAMADEKSRNKSKRLELKEKEKKRRAAAEEQKKKFKGENGQNIGRKAASTVVIGEEYNHSDSEEETNNNIGSEDDSDVDAWGLNEEGEKERIDVRFKRWKSELRSYCAAKKVEDLHLDEGRKIGYTYKCIASGVWAVKQPIDNFKLIMTKLVMEGGDADTNGAVAGAMLGAKIGYNKLPKDWISLMPYKDWLEKRLDRLIRYMGLDPNAFNQLNNNNNNIIVDATK